MKFSVIIPIYNSEDSLPGCIESIMNQTYPDWELILVDDGSTDGSYSLCENYSRKDERIRVIHQKNAGQGSARNNGMKAAAGDYIVFCDADDFYERNALEIFANTAQKEKMLDLMIGGYREFRFSGVSSVEYVRSIVGIESSIQNPDDIRHAYIPLRKRGLITSVWAKAYRRELIIENNIWFPDLRRCEDIVFNLFNFDQIQSLRLLNETVYNYQTPDGDGYTRKFPVDMFEINKQLMAQYQRYLKKWDVFDADAIRYCNQVFIKDVSVLLRLNYVNQWQLSQKDRRALSRKMLHDETTLTACRTVPEGKTNQIIRLILKTRSVTLTNLFSAVTLLYQKVRRSEGQKVRRAGGLNERQSLDYGHCSGV